MYSECVFYTNLQTEIIQKNFKFCISLESVNISKMSHFGLPKSWMKSCFVIQILLLSSFLIKIYRQDTKRNFTITHLLYKKLFFSLSLLFFNLIRKGLFKKLWNPGKDLLVISKENIIFSRRRKLENLSIAPLLLEIFGGNPSNCDINFQSKTD